MSWTYRVSNLKKRIRKEDETIMNKFIPIINKQIEESFWPGYVHTYPHKRAYRPIKDISMKDIWNECLDKLNLYVHVPFCKSKCTYCNLFSAVYPITDVRTVYNSFVDRVIDEIDFYANIIDNNTKVMSLYFGGGTPSLLDKSQLGRIIQKFESIFPNWDGDIEPCIECSPESLSTTYLDNLKSLGFKRISVGIQSFNPEELDIINRDKGIANFYDIFKHAQVIGLATNIDLIYGLPGQSKESAFSNIVEATKLKPETLTVYPLAIRELTGISKNMNNACLSMVEKYQMYDKIRELIEENGYACQTVVRYIRKQDSTYQQQRYEYQGIPTLGVGAGARSYSPNVHYCMSYKVNEKLVKDVVNEYISKGNNEITFDGFIFNDDEHKRKFIALTLLDPFLDINDYKSRFGSEPDNDYPEEFIALQETGLIVRIDNNFILTQKGRKYSDITVSLFESENVKNLLRSYVAQ